MSMGEPVILDSKMWFDHLEREVIDKDTCIQCGACIAVCPPNVIGIGENNEPVLIKPCTACGLCWDFCPRGGLRYESTWKITGSGSHIKGVGNILASYTSRVKRSDFKHQDGGVVTAMLAALLEDESEHGIDAALVAAVKKDEPWKGVPRLVTSVADLYQTGGTFYNQTMALSCLDEKTLKALPDAPRIALVGTPCEIQGLRAMAKFDHDYGGFKPRAVKYTFALFCTKNFDYDKFFVGKLQREKGLNLRKVTKVDVIRGTMLVYGENGETLVEEPVKNYRDVALKGCDECADFTGKAADISVGSEGSEDDYSSVLLRSEAGQRAWNIARDRLEWRALDDIERVEKIQRWKANTAEKTLDGDIDPEAGLWINYPGRTPQTNHQEVPVL